MICGVEVNREVVYMGYAGPEQHTGQLDTVSEQFTIDPARGEHVIGKGVHY